MTNIPTLQPAPIHHVHKRVEPGSVDTLGLADGVVTSDKLAADAVVAGKIAAGAISQSSDFAAGVVDQAAIGTDAVGSDELAVAAVAALDLLGSNLFNLNVTRAVPGATRTTTSATYVNWPVTDNLSISYTKAIAASRLLVAFVGTGYGTTANALAQFAIQVDAGADTEISRYFFSALNDHRTFGGLLSITGIGAGARTIRLRAHTDGAMGLNADGSDFNVLAVLELP